MVSGGAGEAVVSAGCKAPAIRVAAVATNGIAIEPGEPLMILRIVKAYDGSRAFVNDSPASAGLLRELGGQLVEIHGQHDDRGLLNPRGHRALLDTFGRIDEIGRAHV